METVVENCAPSLALIGVRELLIEEADDVSGASIFPFIGGYLAGKVIDFFFENILEAWAWEGVNPYNNPYMFIYHQMTGTPIDSFDSYYGN